MKIKSLVFFITLIHSCVSKTRIQQRVEWHASSYGGTRGTQQEIWYSPTVAFNTGRSIATSLKGSCTCNIIRGRAVPIVYFSESSLRWYIVYIFPEVASFILFSLKHNLYYQSTIPVYHLMQIIKCIGKLYLINILFFIFVFPSYFRILIFVVNYYPFKIVIVQAHRG